MFANIILVILFLKPFNELDSLNEKKNLPLIFITNEIIDSPNNNQFILSKEKFHRKKKKSLRKRRKMHCRPRNQR